jgi:hypothetical protein
MVGMAVREDHRVDAVTPEQGSVSDQLGARILRCPLSISSVVSPNAESPRRLADD